MRHIVARCAFIVSLALGLVGSGIAQQPGEMEIRQGVIEQISQSQIPSNHHAGVGAIIGGLSGLGIGSLTAAARDAM